MLEKLWNKWKALGNKIFLFQARLLLTIFYFLIIYPIGILSNFKRNKSATLWENKDSENVSNLNSLQQQ